MPGSAVSLRSAVHNVLEGPINDERPLGLLQRFIVALILLNAVAVILESNRNLYAAYAEFFHAFELFSVIVFTIEYLARLWIARDNSRYAHLPPWRARLAYMISPMALIDLLAIAPFYLSLFIAIDLRYLRFFRLFRLMKLSHYFDGLKIFSEVLRGEASAIAAALMAVLMLIVVSACLMFTVENAAVPGHFENITQAIWWTVVTLTTVGYGDITPITFAGKLLAMVIMLLGVGTVALPAGILAARFSEELQMRREILKLEVDEAFADGVLDAGERETIERLRRSLGLSDVLVERLIARRQHQAARHRFCPHCGEKLQ